jgi:hypothetical protein
MKNIIDYAQNEQRTFDEKSFCAVDSLILSTVSYWKFDSFVPGPLSHAAPVPLQWLLVNEGENLVRNLRDANEKQALCDALIKCRRFSDTSVTCYVNQTDEAVQKQFSAVTFLLPDNTAYIAYRGTDASIVGWKEDFNMAYVCPVPSQQEGAFYLGTVAGLIPRLLRVGGHSKGGNLAVYAAMACEKAVRARILEIYNHDGPGFREEVAQSDGYKAIESRIRLTLPQSSIIGMLLYQKGQYDIVESNRYWISQHDPFSWEIEGDDFNYAERLTHSATYLNETLERWISSYSDEQRALFIDSIFEVIKATNATSLSDLSDSWRTKAIAALGALKGIDPTTRKFLRQTIGALFFLSMKNMRRRKARLAAMNRESGDAGSVS